MKPAPFSVDDAQERKTNAPQEISRTVSVLVVHGNLNKWMDGWMGGWIDGWMDGWMDGWIDGWKDG